MAADNVLALFLLPARKMRKLTFEQKKIVKAVVIVYLILGSIPVGDRTGFDNGVSWPTLAIVMVYVILFFFAVLIVDFLKPLSLRNPSHAVAVSFPAFIKSKMKAVAASHSALGLPSFGAIEEKACSAVISISSRKVIPFSPTSKRIADPVGARLDFT